MKIEEIYTQNLGSVPNGKLSLVNEWTGEVENRVLFTGINGCGKSTLLRAIAMMWEALGIWLEHQKILPENHYVARYFENNDISVALILSDVQEITGSPNTKIGLVFGDEKWFINHKLNQRDDIEWIGEVYPNLIEFSLFYHREDYFAERVKSNQSLPFYFPKINKTKWLETWSHKRKALMISDSVKSLPNMMYLDAEERRWVSPKENIGEYYADLVSQRWLIKYLVNTDWRGQLEASLINLKILDHDEFCRAIEKLNQFFTDKKIQKKVTEYSNRIEVKGKNFSHNLDELSAGEHQVLIMLFLMLRWLQKGGIVLIDEPDLYLHPSLVQGFLATLELEAEKLGAQLIITSHSDDVWRRYEDFGVRIDMSGGEYNVR